MSGVTAPRSQPSPVRLGRQPAFPAFEQGDELFRVHPDLRFVAVYVAVLRLVRLAGGKQDKAAGVLVHHLLLIAEGVRADLCCIQQPQERGPRLHYRIKRLESFRLDGGVTT